MPFFNYYDMTTLQQKWLWHDNIWPLIRENTPCIEYSEVHLYVRETCEVHFYMRGRKHTSDAWYTTFFNWWGTCKSRQHRIRVGLSPKWVLDLQVTISIFFFFVMNDHILIMQNKSRAQYYLRKIVFMIHDTYSKGSFGWKNRKVRR